MIDPIPGKATRKQYEMQGWNAALHGYHIDQCPYFESSTAWECWRKGFRSRKPDKSQTKP